MSDYNGWANYPTWNVHLWLTNDEGLYRSALHMAAMAKADREDMEPAYRLENELQSWCEDLLPEIMSEGASFASDLLGWAMGHVDWREIAQAFLSDIAEGVEV